MLLFLAAARKRKLNRPATNVRDSDAVEERIIPMIAPVAVTTTAGVAEIAQSKIAIDVAPPTSVMTLAQETNAIDETTTKVETLLIKTEKPETVEIKTKNK